MEMEMSTRGSEMASGAERLEKCMVEGREIRAGFLEVVGGCHSPGMVELGHEPLGVHIWTSHS